MRSLIIILVVLLVTSNFVYSQYTPSQHTPMNKPVGIAQAVPTDARSYYYDGSSFTYRPYNSTSEALTYLNTATKRSGHFPIYVLSGGIVRSYMFRNGVLDANLVEMTMFGSGLDSTMYSYDGTLTGNRTVNLSTSTLTFTNGSSSVTPTKFDKGVMMATSSGNVYVGTASDSNFNYGSTIGNPYIPRFNVNGKTRVNGELLIPPIGNPGGISVGSSSSSITLLGRGSDASNTITWARIFNEGYGPADGSGTALSFTTSGFLRFSPTVAQIQFANGNYNLTYGANGMTLTNNSYTGAISLRNSFKQTSGYLFNVIGTTSAGSYSHMFINYDHRVKFLCDTVSAQAIISDYAAFDIESSKKGLLIPRLTTSARTSLGTGAPKGLMVYDTAANNLYFYNGSAWVAAGSGGSSLTTSTYTPSTVLGWVNVSSLSTSSLVNYTNYGNQVEVWGEVSMTTSVAATATAFEFDLPVSPGSLSGSYELSGSLVASDGTSGRVSFKTSNSRALFQCTPSTTTSRTYSFRFIYRVAAL